MTLKKIVRDVLNKQCEAAAMKQAAWSDPAKRPEVVVDDSIGRLIKSMHGMLSRRLYAPLRPDQAVYGYEDAPQLVKDGKVSTIGGADDDEEDNEKEGAEEEEEEEDDSKEEGAEKKRAAARIPRRRPTTRRPQHVADGSDMTTKTDHEAAIAAVAVSSADGSPLPTHFYETKAFLEAEKIGRPLIPLFQQFAIPVLAWFKEGVRIVVCCLDKGTVKAKARTAKQRARDARRRRTYPYADTVRMTKEGSLYDEAKRGTDGRFGYVSMDYARLMITRRLRNEAFEWFAHAFSATARLPNDCVLFMDYADPTGKHPIALEIKNNSIKDRKDLANSYGEGDVAIINWLRYFGDKNAMVSAIDGDMFGILSHYLYHRVANALPPGKRGDYTCGPFLYWSDHEVYRNMNVFLMCLREINVHPLIIALLCILPSNDFFMMEDKNRLLYRINGQTIWEGLRAVQPSVYTKFSACLEAAHKYGRPRSAEEKAKYSDVEKRVEEKQRADMRTQAKAFVKEIQGKIIDAKPKPKPRKNAPPPKVKSTKELEKDKVKDEKKKAAIKKQYPVTQYLSDLIVGNLEYWYYGHSIVNPDEFTAVVGLQWRAVAKTRAELDKEELGDLERVGSH